MQIANSRQLAWCATFAALYSFETHRDRSAAMAVAREAYDQAGSMSAAEAVRAMVQAGMTWPARSEEQRSRWSTFGD
jgi:hypothetical protein